MLQIIQAQMMEQGELFFRLVAACVLGGAIGFERKNRNKGAGMRTHALVCMGAALIMVTSKYGFADTANYDASRVAAQVVSGIGFLGAGIIFVRNNSISGLTTAAGIWVTSGVGLSMGAGQYFLATASTILMITVQVILHSIGFLAKEPYRAGLKITVRNNPTAVQEIEELLKNEKIEIMILKVSREQEDTKLELEVVYPAGYDKLSFLNRLLKKEEIVMVRG